MADYISPNTPDHYDDYFDSESESDSVEWECTCDWFKDNLTSEIIFQKCDLCHWESDTNQRYMTIEHLIIQSYIQLVESQNVESKRVSMFGEMLEYLMTIPDTIAMSPPFRTELVRKINVIKTLPLAIPILSIIVRTEAFIDTLKTNKRYAQ